MGKFQPAHEEIKEESEDEAIKKLLEGIAGDELEVVKVLCDFQGTFHFLVQFCLA
jgi:hypothetical protein